MRPDRRSTAPIFVTARADLEAKLRDDAPARAGGHDLGQLAEAGVEVTDITEDVIRDVALPMHLVDVKVCSVDDIWSGLKLVIGKSTTLKGKRT